MSVKIKHLEFLHQAYPCWKPLNTKFGPNLDLKHLLLLAQVVSWRKDIPLSRNDKRTKLGLIQWFQKNWDDLSDLLMNQISIIYEEEEEKNEKENK